MSNPSTSGDLKSRRLQSLDLFRGLIMFLLVAEGTGLYGAMNGISSPDTLFHGFVEQFHHHPWNGLRFWDLIQPYFMFIVGVAMPFSLAHRQKQGFSRQENLLHILRRCLLLLLFGVMLHCGYKGAIVWELWNVLSQLSFTILVAYLIMHWSPARQILVSAGLILLTEMLYRFTNISGFDQPFVQGKNFGAFMDLVLMGKINPDGWVAINCIPTAAHTIWGVVAGQLIRKQTSAAFKFRWLLLPGVGFLILGYGLDALEITPIIKRICTSSFILASGGWCLLTLSLFYWLVDVKDLKSWTPFFIIVGMNPIFIYLFSQSIGGMWFNDYVAIYTRGILSPLAAADNWMDLINALIVLALEWGLCFWLYKRRIFFRI